MKVKCPVCGKQGKIRVYPAEHNLFVVLCERCGIKSLALAMYSDLVELGLTKFIVAA